MQAAIFVWNRASVSPDCAEDKELEEFSKIQSVLLNNLLGFSKISFTACM